MPGLGDRTVVYNGAVEPRKNMDGLITAFARLPDEVRRRHQLVLVCRLQPLERNHYEVLGRQLGLGQGELLLTGLVADEALVHLYRSATLVVFPSFYEGYGLPVAEAMACGAPVVASGNSSLRELVDPEATFDPHDEHAITDAIERGLVDEAYRDRLRRWSARPQPTWTEVAHRAAAVYRQLTTEPGGTRPRPPGRLAQAAAGGHGDPVAAGHHRGGLLLTPAGPGHGRLGGPRPLRRRGHDPKPPSAIPNFPSYPARALPLVDPVQGGYEAVVACVGNSEHHAGALAAVRPIGCPPPCWPTTCGSTGSTGTGRPVVRSPRGTLPWWPGCTSRPTPDWIKDGWLQPDEAEEHDVYLARELIGLADPFIVTSEYAAEVARQEARPGDRGRVVVCPYAYPPAAPRPAGREQPGLVATFGLVNAIKQPELLVAGFALLHRGDPATHLAFVGPIDPALRERYHALAVRLGVADGITFTGGVNDDEYEAWLDRTSVAVQLRARTNGETSGAVADCLSHGVATVVTDAGPAHQLPDLVAKVPRDREPATLAEVVGELLADAGERAASGRRGPGLRGPEGFDRGARHLLAALDLAPTGAARPGPS